jgi:glucosamine-phosphate N-acetyltransferase
MIIRELTPNDINEQFIEVLEALAPVDASREELLETHAIRKRRGVKTFIGIVGGRIVATGSLVIEHKFIHSCGRVGHVEEVAVLEECQGKGYGREMMKFIIARASLESVYKILLNCSPKAAAFYVGLGFEKKSHGMRLDLN